MPVSLASTSMLTAVPDAVMAVSAVVAAACASGSMPSSATVVAIESACRFMVVPCGECGGLAGPWLISRALISWASPSPRSRRMRRQLRGSATGDQPVVLVAAVPEGLQRGVAAAVTGQRHRADGEWAGHLRARDGCGGEAGDVVAVGVEHAPGERQVLLGLDPVSLAAVEQRPLETGEAIDDAVVRCSPWCCCRPHRSR